MRLCIETNFFIKLITAMGAKEFTTQNTCTLIVSLLKFLRNLLGSLSMTLDHVNDSRITTIIKTVIKMALDSQMKVSADQVKI